VKIPSKYIDNAVEQLSSLPGVGKRTALRLVLHLLKKTSDEMEGFTNAFKDLKLHVKTCKSCGNISDDLTCSICSNPKRDPSILCVVEDIRDILAIESTESYHGMYHVLGGIISPMDGIGPSDLNISSLISRTESGSVKEIIFALSPTMEGDTTNFYLYKKLHGFPVVITTLSRGVAVGTELQYADELTLSRSIQQRQIFHV
jgi:recombination protein RecR